MSNNRKDDYKVCIWGTTVSKREANRIGLTLILAFIFSIIIATLFGIENKIAVFLLSIILWVIGYFGIALKIFPDKPKT